MRAAIVFSLAALMLAAAADAQPPRPQPQPTAARQPLKCAEGERRVQTGACSAPHPWRCEPCQHGVRTLRIDDKCGAPIQFCRRAVGH
jgi:hypothetical protein